MKFLCLRATVRQSVPETGSYPEYLTQKSNTLRSILAPQPGLHATPARVKLNNSLDQTAVSKRDAIR